MTYEEFSDKLRVVKVQFKKRHGKNLNTIEELENYLTMILVKPKRKALKSLRGLYF